MGNDMILIEPTFQMWVTCVVVIGALVVYASERLQVEVTSMAVIGVLLVFFHLFPVEDPAGDNLLSSRRLLEGFANPALITVLALLVIGQGMVRTGVLDRAGHAVIDLCGGHLWASVLLTFVAVLTTSAFLNNIPVVVIFIPIMQILADRLNHPPSKVMMGLSFTAILGGQMTLIGSGSNLLVSGALQQMGRPGLSFFEFTVPGLVIALTGLAYVLLILPRILPNRTSLADRLMDRAGKYFLGQISVNEGSHLIDIELVGSLIRVFPDVRVRMLLRGEQVMLPPFHHLKVEKGDVIVVAASRKALTNVMAAHPDLMHPLGKEGRRLGRDEEEQGGGNDRTVAEVMVAPASRMIGQTIRLMGFQYRTRCLVLGIRRHGHIFRSRMTDVRLRAGDLLLIEGDEEDVHALAESRDVVLLHGSTSELPALHDAKRAALVFAGVVGLAATGILPIVVASLVGAVAMIMLGVLNIRQATRAIDARIVTMIGAALAMGMAIQETGAASWVAYWVVQAVQGASVPVVLSVFFLMMALLSNLISSNACAVLFTPIGVGIALQLGVDPRVFAIAVVFAANCGLATPIAYQTSLLVMGPGNYRFIDFTKAGLPLVFLIWIAFSLVMPWYYDL